MQFIKKNANFWATLKLNDTDTKKRITGLLVGTRW